MNQTKTNETETENSVQKNTILDNLYKEFTCTICLHFFTEPVTVSICKHTFCQDCLKQWRLKSSQSTSKTFKCPLCKNITTNRSFYLNDKYAIVVKFLNDLNVFMESKQQIDESKNTLFPRKGLCTELLSKYLNDCIKYKLAFGSDEPDVIIDLSIKSGTDVVEVPVITESEENEFILGICSTAENINIIKQLENDVIDSIENETKTPRRGAKKANNSKLNDNTTAATSTLNKTNDSAKKTGWTRMKTIKRDIKKTAKYKRLKVTNKSNEKKRATRSSKNKTEHFDVFDEYIQEKKNASLLETTDNNAAKNIENVENIEKNIEDVDDDEDVFLRSTQILNLETLTPERNVTLGKRKSLENVASQQELQAKKNKTPEAEKNVTLTKRNSLENVTISKQDSQIPDKNGGNIIIVNADVHHSNDSVISERTRRNPSDNDIIENTEELVSKVIDPELQTLNTKFKETMKEVSELKSSVLQSLEQNMKESDNILAEYSSVIYSDSLFSSASNKTTKHKIPSNKICSAPNLNTCSNESITFYNTAIPCLEKIKSYLEQLKIISEHFTDPSAISNDSKHSSNCLKTNDAGIQTDIFKCPSCTFTFNLKSDSVIPAKTQPNAIPKSISSSVQHSNSNSEDFNAFLENVKKNISSVNDERNETIHEVKNKDETEKKRFKRIRAPTESDSDESSGQSKKSRNNSFQSKLLYREDNDVCFQNSSISQGPDNKGNKSVMDKLTPLGNNKSSEDTLVYLEQQYKNPINLTAERSPEKTPNIDNLLSEIDPSVFENEFTNVGSTENQTNQSKTELSASLFTETQIAKPKTTSNEEPENIDNVSIISDSCGSEDIFEDDIVDTTPQKPPEVKDKNTSLILKNKEIGTKCLTGDSQLELRKLQNQNYFNQNNIASMTPDVLPLSNVDLNCGFFNTSNKTQPSQLDSQAKKLNPIAIIQNEQNSPLVLIKQQQNSSKHKIEITKHQSSILSYISNKNPDTSQISEKSISTVAERCESPVLHSRPVLPAILCTTRLQSDENSTIMTYASRLNARFTNVFNKSVTHLIVKVNENNCIVDQTIKYALAIAHGIWILNYSWFKDSLSQNRLLPEEPYEVLDISGLPGPQLSRLKRKTSPVFRDFVFYIAEPVVTATRADLEAVILNLGGEIKSQPDELQNIPGKHCLILAEGKCCEDFNQFEMWKNQLNVMIVDIEWLSESVGRFDVASIRLYALCSDDNIEHYGYPDALIEQISESQMFS